MRFMLFFVEGADHVRFGALRFGRSGTRNGRGFQKSTYQKGPVPEFESFINVLQKLRKSWNKPDKLGFPVRPGILQKLRKIVERPRIIAF